MAASPDIKVDFLWFDKRDRSHWPIDLSDRLRPGKYNVYIIGDLDSSLFRKEDLEQLRNDVAQGAGLIMLGGFHSFWAGGYQNTPLAEVLPLDVRPIEDKLARQDFDAKIREDLHLKPEPLPGQPGKTGIIMLPDQRFGYEPPMRLAARESNRQAWSKLPALEGANKFEALKPDCATAWQSLRDGKPLLVAGQLGNGRVLAFAGDSTWHWWMQGFDREHKRFWRQVMLWLAKKEESSEQSVWLHLVQRRYPPAAKIDFACGAQNYRKGNRLPAPRSKQRWLAPTARAGRFRWLGNRNKWPAPCTTWSSRAITRSSVTASKDGAPLGEAKARFTVFEQDLEMENAAARPELMASLAKMTAASGGKVVAPEQLPELLQANQKSAARSGSGDRNQVHPLGHLAVLPAACAAC